VNVKIAKRGLFSENSAQWRRGLSLEHKSGEKKTQIFFFMDRQSPVLHPIDWAFNLNTIKCVDAIFVIFKGRITICRLQMIEAKVFKIFIR
jgi:hypothetical protein